MKSYLVITFATIAITVLSSCRNNDNEERKSSVSETLDGLEMTAQRNALRTVSAVTIKPDNTYVDLKTNKVVRIRMDTITRNIYDLESKYPIDYVIDPSTKDTFDRTGRIVNSALILDKDGNWIVDESKLQKKEN